ncbi:unnamed protein product [Rotaria sp. Silwood1]|nr:unnamed protein product [Rotaria sp. Silwood1]CAF1587426.1 unnamed protein product [Rotaria sp. Silwood1]
MATTTVTVDEETDDEILYDDDLSTPRIAIALNDSVTLSPITLYALRYADPTEKWKIQVIFDNNMKRTFTAGTTVFRPTTNSSYGMFNSLIEQFTTIINEEKRNMSNEDFKEFFETCLNYYSSIENIVQQDMHTLKILIRMMACVPINRNNMIIPSKATQSFISNVLKVFLDKLLDVWIEVVDSEWKSFCHGLATLVCIRIYYEESENEMNFSLDSLMIIPDGTRRQELIFQLVDLLNSLTCTLIPNQDDILFTIIGPDKLCLQHLEVTSSLSTYVVYLIKILESYQDDENQLHTHITNQLDKLLEEKHFRIQLHDIIFILNLGKTEINETNNRVRESATQKIQLICESNLKMKQSFEVYLNEKNFHISIDEIPSIYAIIFRYFNPFLLPHIDRQQYILRTISRREDRTTDYFIEWFKHFLCQSNPDWMHYDELLYHWTECFVHNTYLFNDIIKQIDKLIELWTKVELANDQRSGFFVEHIVKECFRHGKMID